MFAYCLNNPTNCFDPSGTVSFTGLSEEAKVQSPWREALAGAGNALIKYGGKVVAAFTITAYLYETDSLPLPLPTRKQTRKLERVAESNPDDERVYCIAYIGAGNELVRLPSSLQASEARDVLIYFSFRNGNSGYNVKPSTRAIGDIFDLAEQAIAASSKGVGIYTQDAGHASYLAASVGIFTVPEVHRSGYYGHYNNASHQYHIWFGGPIYYG